MTPHRGVTRLDPIGSRTHRALPGRFPPDWPFGGHVVVFPLLQIRRPVPGQPVPRQQPGPPRAPARRVFLIHRTGIVRRCRVIGGHAACLGLVETTSFPRLTTFASASFRPMEQPIERATELIHHRQPGHAGEQREAAHECRDGDQRGASHTDQRAERTGDTTAENAARLVRKIAGSVVEMQVTQRGRAHQQQHQPAGVNGERHGVPGDLHLGLAHQSPGAQTEHAWPPQRTGAEQRIEHIG